MKGLGPYRVTEVAIGLVALGIAGIVWGLLSTYIMATATWVPLVSGVGLVVAGLGVAFWDHANPGSKAR